VFSSSIYPQFPAGRAPARIPMVAPGALVVWPCGSLLQRVSPLRRELQEPQRDLWLVRGGDHPAFGCGSRTSTLRFGAEVNAVLTEDTRAIGSRSGGWARFCE